MELVGGFPDYVPPPLIAIDKFLQGQSRTFMPSKEEEKVVCTRLYDDDDESSKVSYNSLVVPSSCMDKIFFDAASHGCVFSNNYQTQLLGAADEAIFKRGGGGGVSKMKMKTKTKGGRKSSVIKGPWTDEEDRKLVRLVKQNGVRRWAHIAEQMIGRAGKQCRERWHNHLRPDIKKDTWSEEEERMLVEAHQKIGNKWAEIAKLIPGRSENAIKNHWNATKRRQISSRKPPKKNEAKKRKCRSSILQEYIRSKDITTSASHDHHHYNIASTTTIKAIRGSSTTISSNELSNKSNIIFPTLPVSYSDDSPSLDITQSYDDELTFMQTFFGDSKLPIITQYSNTNISSESQSTHIKEPISPLDIKPIEFNGNSHCQYAPYSSMFNESIYTKDLEPLASNSIYGYPSSSSLIYNESSLNINPNSSFGGNPLGFSGNLLYGFDSSSSSVAHDDRSNVFYNQEESLETQLASDHVYISNYLLEGSTTTLSNNYSCDRYGYYGGIKKELVSDGEQSTGSAGSSSINGEKEMDLVEMVLSSHLSQGSNFVI